MKKYRTITPGLMLRFNFAALLLLTITFGSCTGKSNAEDDTFKQSVIDDPSKAQRENEAAKVGLKVVPDTTDTINR